jgi:hypothetical protein
LDGGRGGGKEGKLVGGVRGRIEGGCVSLVAN